MTFDEYDKELMELVDRYGDEPYYGDIDNLVDKLQETYAPTVEMTKEQARVFTLYYDSKKPFNKNEFEYPDNLFMESISDKELTQAWLHPETIKIVEETK